MPNRPTVTQRIAAYIKEQIHSGTWPAGSKLPSESQLCAELQASRVSVRSALQQLDAVGLIHTVRGKGSYVRSQLPHPTPDLLHMEPEKLREFHKFMLIVWPPVAAAAAESPSEAFLASLDQLVEKLQQISPSDTKELYHLIRCFHTAISAAHQNSYLNFLAQDMLYPLLTSVTKTEASKYYYFVTYYCNILRLAYHSRTPKAVQEHTVSFLNKLPEYIFL